MMRQSRGERGIARATLTADELAVVQVHMHLPVVREPRHNPERQRCLRGDARAEDTRRVHCDTAPSA